MNIFVLKFLAISPSPSANTTGSFDTLVYLSDPVIKFPWFPCMKYTFHLSMIYQNYSVTNGNQLGFGGVANGGHSNVNMSLFTLSQRA